MTIRSTILVMLGVVVAACGGSDQKAAPGVEGASNPAASPIQAASTEAETAAFSADGPILTEVPDPCEYLTQADAEELLGRPTGPGRSLDAGGWNCVYDTDDPRRRLVFDMQLGRDATVESTQLGMTIEACQAEVVARPPDLGIDAALYENSGDVCGEGSFLWVATDASFEGQPFPGGEREVSRRIHLAVSVSPPGGDAAEILPLLRDAAERGLARLDG